MKSSLRTIGFFCLLLALLAPSTARSNTSATAPFAPFRGDAQHDTFSFVVYGDIQDNYKQGHQALVRQMLTEKAHLVFNTGDISENGGQGYADSFYPVVNDLIRKFPFFPAVGNHDIRWNSPESRVPFYSFFNKSFQYLATLPGNEHLRGTMSQKLWYSFIYSDVLFVVLDSNFFIDEGQYRSTHSLPAYAGYRDEQLKWVRKLLQSATEDDSLRAKFVFLHHSPFTSVVTSRRIPFVPIGGHPGHREMLLNQKMPSDGGEQPVYLLDLIRKAGVTAVFSGHEHFYERWSEEIRDERGPVRRLNWVVNGLGGVKPRGEPLYRKEDVKARVDSEDIARYRGRVKAINPGWTSDLRHAYPNENQTDARFHNYVLVTIDGDEVRFQAKDITGRVRDQGLFTLPAVKSAPAFTN